MHRLFKDWDLLYLSGAEWSGIQYRKQILSRELSQFFGRVFYWNKVPTRKIRLSDGLKVAKRLTRRSAKRASEVGKPANLRVLDSVLIPETLPGGWTVNDLLVRRIARRHRLRPDRLAVISNTPGANSLHLLQRLRPAVSVYDCDHHYARCPWVAAEVAAQESRLVEACDAVVCDSAFLTGKWTAHHRDVTRIPPGVDQALLQRASSCARPAGAPPYRIGYFGTVRADTNTRMLNALAEAGHRVFCQGIVSQPPPEPLSHRVELRPPVHGAAYADALAGPDVLILPYLQNEYTAGVFPAKVYEMLATGKPVLATPLPELLPFRDSLYLVETVADAVAAAGRLGREESALKVEARIRLAREAVWPNRSRDFLRLLERLAGDAATN